MWNPLVMIFVEPILDSHAVLIENCNPRKLNLSIVKKTNLRRFSVQIELMLANGHGPDGLAESGSCGEPDVDVDVGGSESSTSAFSTLVLYIAFSLIVDFHRKLLLTKVQILQLPPLVYSTWTFPDKK